MVEAMKATMKAPVGIHPQAFFGAKNSAQGLSSHPKQMKIHAQTATTDRPMSVDRNERKENCCWNISQPQIGRIRNTTVGSQ